MMFISLDSQSVIIDELTEKKLAAHPGVRDLLPEAISRLSLGDESGRIKKEVDMGRVIGMTDLVAVPDVGYDTQTQFAYRKERKYPSHVRAVDQKFPCTTIALSLVRNEGESEWNLITAFVGKSAPSEPFYYFDKKSWFYRDEKQFKESLDFWMAHALLIDKRSMGEPYVSTWSTEIEKVKMDINEHC